MGFLAVYHSSNPALCSSNCVHERQYSFTKGLPTSYCLKKSCFLRLNLVKIDFHCIGQDQWIPSNEWQTTRDNEKQIRSSVCGSAQTIFTNSNPPPAMLFGVRAGADFTFLLTSHWALLALSPLRISAGWMDVQESWQRTNLTKQTSPYRPSLHTTTTTLLPLYPPLSFPHFPCHPFIPSDPSSSPLLSFCHPLSPHAPALFHCMAWL